MPTFSPEQMKKLAEWGGKGGRNGSRADKIRAVKKAWANPDPMKRPGRKPKPKTTATAAQPVNPGKVLGNEYERIMAQLREP